jgi:hypothetical protein
VSSLFSRHCTKVKIKQEGFWVLVFNAV